MLNGKRILAASFALAMLCVLTPAAPSSAAPLPPVGGGDWIIENGEAYTYLGQTFSLSGNLIVKSGGKLTLNDCVVRMSSTDKVAYNIHVYYGGELNIVGGSQITTDNPLYGYSFRVDGKLSLADSTVESIGGTEVSGKKISGLQIYSDDVKITGSTIQNSTAEYGCGLYILNSKTTIDNTTITGHKLIGIYAENSTLSMTGTTIKSNGGITTAYAGLGAILKNTHATMKNCKVLNHCPPLIDRNATSTYGVVSSDGGSLVMDGCTIDNNGMMGIIQVNGNLTLTKTSISNHNYGIMANVEKHTTVADSTVSGALVGIMGQRCDDVRITRTTLEGGAQNIIMQSSKGEITASTIRGASQCGILTSGSIFTLSGNTITSNEIGAYLQTAGGSIYDNTITKNKQWGIIAIGGSATYGANDFGSSASDYNGKGCISQSWNVLARAVDANNMWIYDAKINITDAYGDRITTFPGGGGVRATVLGYQILNDGTTKSYSPYKFEARKEGVGHAAQSIYVTKDMNVTLTLVALPELSFGSVSLSNASNDASEGRALVISCEVRNSGEMGADNVDVDFRIDGNSIGTQRISRLAAGQTASASARWEEPEPGEYTITIVADPNGNITGDAKDNNVITRKVTITPSGSEVEPANEMQGGTQEGSQGGDGGQQQDSPGIEAPIGKVEVVSLSVGKPQIYAGDRIRVYATVTSEGAVGDVKIRFFDGSTQIGSDIPISLTAGESRNVSITWTASVGMHNLRVEASSGFGMFNAETKEMSVKVDPKPTNPPGGNTPNFTFPILAAAVLCALLTRRMSH